MPVSEFAAAVLATVSDIPAGCVSSYGEVARRAGYPGRARQVGRILSELPAGSSIPWHRVVRADGNLAFPPSHPCFGRQKSALAAEGVRVTGRRVPGGYFRSAPCPAGGTRSTAGAGRRAT